MYGTDCARIFWSQWGYKQFVHVYFPIYLIKYIQSNVPPERCRGTETCARHPSRSAQLCELCWQLSGRSLVALQWSVLLGFSCSVVWWIASHKHGTGICQTILKKKKNSIWKAQLVYLLLVWFTPWLSKCYWHVTLRDWINLHCFWKGTICTPFNWTWVLHTLYNKNSQYKL